MTGLMLGYKGPASLVEFRTMWRGLVQFQSHFLPHPMELAEALVVIVLHPNVSLSSILVQTPEESKHLSFKNMILNGHIILEACL